jgi:murein tripeptide amidase MpaA
VLQISTAPGEGKRAIFIDSAMHAREWIGPPVALYAINQLTEFFDQSSNLLENVDFYIMPMVNPDGYLFTWEEASCNEK